MLSKVTDSEANKKTKTDTASGKLTEATSMIVSYEERGEGELEVDTLVSTTISTAGGPASPSREWPSVPKPSTFQRRAPCMRNHVHERSVVPSGPGRDRNLAT